MPDPRFYELGAAQTLDQALTGAGLGNITEGLDEAKACSLVTGCAPLHIAGPDQVAFFHDPRYLEALCRTRASFVFLKSAHLSHLPNTAIGLVTQSPQAAWARLAHSLYRLRTHEGAEAIHADSRLEPDVQIGPGVVIGPNAHIGSGTVLDSYCVIGPGVQIGRNSRIGAHASLYCLLAGDRVHIASGARIGESGFGVSGDKSGLVDVPQLGRVILQDDVAIGAGTCVDRGAFGDTVVGEGTKIDNMVQIAHNVEVGRQCIIAAHSGISGSVRIGDGARFGGRAGIIDHIRIGAGASVGAGAVVNRDVPEGATWAGYPARAVRSFLRESAWLAKQVAIRNGKE